MKYYQKAEFSEKYATPYNILKSQASGGVLKEPDSYSPVESSVQTLNWEGQGKEGIISRVASIDVSCDYIYKKVTCFVNKANIANNVLYPELKLLKEKIDAYNDSISKYERLCNQQTQIEGELRRAQESLGTEV